MAKKESFNITAGVTTFSTASGYGATSKETVRVILVPADPADPEVTLTQGTDYEAGHYRVDGVANGSDSVRIYWPNASNYVGDGLRVEIYTDLSNPVVAQLHNFEATGHNTPKQFQDQIQQIFSVFAQFLGGTSLGDVDFTSITADTTALGLRVDAAEADIITNAAGIATNAADIATISGMTISVAGLPTVSAAKALWYLRVTAAGTSVEWADLSEDTTARDLVAMASINSLIRRAHTQDFSTVRKPQVACDGTTAVWVEGGDALQKSTDYFRTVTNVISGGDLRSVQYSNGKFVAAGQQPSGSTYAELYVSSDASSFSTLTNSSLVAAFSAGAWNGTTYIGVRSSNGAVYTTTDGVTWNGPYATSAATSDNAGAIWSTIDSKWYVSAVDSSFAGDVYTSSDGITWSAHATLTANCNKFVEVGGRLFAFGRIEGSGAGGEESFSTADGSTWDSIVLNEYDTTLPSTWTVADIVMVGRWFILLAYDASGSLSYPRAFASQDGVTFEQIQMAASYTSGATYPGVALFDNGQVVVIERTGVATGNFFRSNPVI